MNADPIQRLAQGAHGDGAGSLPELAEVIASWCGVLDTRAAGLERLYRHEREQARRALDCAARCRRRAERAENLLELIATWEGLPGTFRESIRKLLERRR